MNFVRKYLYGLIFSIVLISFTAYAFLIPLIGGVLVWSIIGAFSKRRIPGAIFRNLYHSSIAAFTVGSIFNGVIEIYGTKSDFVYIYMACGAVLLMLSIVFCLVDVIKND